jgi:hypothetical protein
MSTCAAVVTAFFSTGHVLSTLCQHVLAGVTSFFSTLHVLFCVASLCVPLLSLIRLPVTFLVTFPSPPKKMLKTYVLDVSVDCWLVGLLHICLNTKFFAQKIDL